MTRAALFNGFSCHYEMFGYFIHYCKKNNIQLDIYTNFDRHYNWLCLYQKLFENDSFKITFFHFTEFEKKIDDYDLIFMATDDDPYFKNEWINNKTICIDHNYAIRRRNPFLKHRISTRKFREERFQRKFWSLPCFPIINITDKKTIMNNNENDTILHIAMVGGTHSLKRCYNMDVINRLRPINENYRIVLHAISRDLHMGFFDNVRDDIELKIYSTLDTLEMVQILAKCSYFLTDIDYNANNIYGYGMSGGVPLAFSTLLPIIMSSNNNAIYNFKSTVTFDMNNNDYILLSENVNPLIDLVYEERNELMDMFDTNIKNIISTFPENTKMNTALLVESRFLKKIPMLIQEYSKILGGGWNIVFYCGKGLKYKWQKVFNDLFSKEDVFSNSEEVLFNLEIRELPVENMNFIDYNNFLRSKMLWESLYGEYVLVFNSDTMIKNMEPYTIDNYMALNKSYIGSNMSHNWNELIRENIFPSFKNFNGILSLRKRKDMIQIIDIGN